MSDFSKVPAQCLREVATIGRQYGVTVNDGLSRMVLGETYSTKGQSAAIMADILQVCGPEVKDMTLANLNNLFIASRQAGNQPAVNQSAHTPPR